MARFPAVITLDRIQCFTQPEASGSEPYLHRAEPDLVERLLRRRQGDGMGGSPEPADRHGASARPSRLVPPQGVRRLARIPDGHHVPPAGAIGDREILVVQPHQSGMWT